MDGDTPGTSAHSCQVLRVMDPATANSKSGSAIDAALHRRQWVFMEG
jgi:hypothetical protein